MPDGFLVTALMGAVAKVAGSLAGNVLEAKNFKGWLDGCRLRLRAGRDIPKNLDLVRGVRTAHLAAIKAVALQHQKLLPLQPAGKLSGDEYLFCKAALEFCDARLKVFTDNEIDHDAVSPEDIALLLESPLAKAADANYQKVTDSARDTATRSALEELEKYAKFEAPKLFIDVFTGHNGIGWYDIYSRYVTDQIKSNEPFRWIFFTAQLADVSNAVASIEQLIEQRFNTYQAILKTFQDELRQYLTQIDQQLKHILDNVRAGGQNPLIRIDIEHEGKGSAWTFNFRCARDIFQGRMEDFEHIEYQLFSSQQPDIREKFRWLVIVGSGGSGKSRFALELLKRNRFRWAVNGFVSENFVDGIHANDWVVEQPTLLVVDYAASKPELYDFIRVFAERAHAGHLAHPVRLVLIDRRRNEPVIQKLLADSAASASQNLRVCGPDDVYILKKLSKEAVIEIMRSRVKDTPANTLHDDTLLSHLDAFDPGRRPLLAAIVADALAKNELPALDEDSSREDGRWKLFNAFVVRAKDNLNQRLEAEPHEAAARIHLPNRYMALAALATMVRGIDRKAYDFLYGAGRWKSEPFYIPAPTHGSSEYALRRELYGELSGYQADVTEKVLEAIEPDLIGECLVLSVMLDDGEYEGRGAWLRSLAWSMAPYSVAAFVRLCYQDYSRHTESVDYLLGGDDPQTCPARSALVQALVNDLATKANDNDTPDDHLLRRMFAVIDRIDNSMLQQFATDPAVARNIAAAMLQVMNLASRAIAPRIGQIELDLDPVLASTSDVPIRLLRQFRLAQDAPATREHEATKLAIIKLPDLIRSAQSLCSRSPNGDVAGLLAKAVSDAVSSVYWVLRHRPERGGLASAPLSRQDKLEFNQLVDDAFTTVSREDAPANDMECASAIITAATFATYGNSYDFALAKRISDWLSGMSVNLTERISQHASALRLYSNVILWELSRSDLESAGLRISVFHKRLQELPFDWTKANRTQRSSWLTGQTLVFLLLEKTKTDSIDSMRLWQYVVTHERFTTGLEDGQQQDRVEAAMAVIRGWNKTAPQQAQTVWQHATDWLGQSKWDNWSCRRIQIESVIWALMVSESVQPQTLEVFLHRLDVVYPNHHPDSHLSLPAIIGQTVQAFFPHSLHDTPALTEGTIVLRTALGEWLTSREIPDASIVTSGWLQLMVQYAIKDGPDTVIGPADLLLGSPCNTVPVHQALCQLASTLGLMPGLDEPSLIRLDSWVAAAEENGVELVTLRTARQTLLWARGERSALGVTHDGQLGELDQTLVHILLDQLPDHYDAPTSAYLPQLQHLRGLLTRTPVEEAIEKFANAVDQLPQDDASKTDLEMTYIRLKADRDVREAFRKRNSEIRQELAGGLRPYKTAWNPITEALLVEPSAWPFEPLFPGPWQDVNDSAQAATWLNRIASAMQGETLFDEYIAGLRLAIRVCPLLFRADSALIEVLLSRRPDRPDASPLSVLILLTEEGAMYLDGSSGKIHRLHEDHGAPQLDTAEAALAYLRFFCGAIQGDLGPFTIVDDKEQLLRRVVSDDLSLQTLDLPPIVPPKLLPILSTRESESKRVWRARVVVHHGSLLANAEFELLASGVVNMTDDTPLWDEPGKLRQPCFHPPGFRGWPA